MSRLAAAGLTIAAVVGGTVAVAASPAAAAVPYRFEVHTDKVQDGDLTVFFRITGAGTGGAVEHAWRDASGIYSSWYSLGKPPGPNLIGSPSAVRTPDGRITIFAVSAGSSTTTRRLWHKWQLCDGCGWSDWADLGATAQGIDSIPDAVYKASLNVFVVFVMNNTGGVSHKWQLCPGCGWSAWSNLGGGPFASFPIAGLTDTDAAYVVIFNQFEQLFRRTQMSSTGDWYPWQ